MVSANKWFCGHLQILICRKGRKEEGDETVPSTSHCLQVDSLQIKHIVYYIKPYDQCPLYNPNDTTHPTQTFADLFSTWIQAGRANHIPLVRHSINSLFRTVKGTHSPHTVWSPHRHTNDSTSQIVCTRHTFFSLDIQLGILLVLVCMTQQNNLHTKLTENMEEMFRWNSAFFFYKTWPLKSFKKFQCWLQINRLSSNIHSLQQPCKCKCTTSRSKANFINGYHLSY